LNIEISILIFKTNIENNKSSKLSPFSTYLLSLSAVFTTSCCFFFSINTWILANLPVCAASNKSIFFLFHYSFLKWTSQLKLALEQALHLSFIICFFGSFSLHFRSAFCYGFAFQLLPFFCGEQK
jgi:hypothetical protein